MSETCLQPRGPESEASPRLDPAWNDPVKLRAAMRRLQLAADGVTLDFEGDARKRDEYVRAWRRVDHLLQQASKAGRAAPMERAK